jgi:tRNA threonylcarbamoyladenosine biosynthesis protein TsaB
LNSSARPESVLRSMLSLRQILAQHSPVLLIDSSSAVIQVSLWAAGREAVWETAEVEASTGVFSATEKLLQAAQLNLSAIEAFVFCAGPGSVLGIRTAAVAIRTWNAIRPRPVFSFSSLEVVAHFEKQKRAEQPFSVIADARRETWHEVKVDASGNVSALQRVPASAFTNAGARVMPAAFRHWAPLPPSTETVPYTLAEILKWLSDTALFSENSDPDAFLHEAPAYLTWTPQIHRAPSAS